MLSQASSSRVRVYKLHALKVLQSVASTAPLAAPSNTVTRLGKFSLQNRRHSHWRVAYGLPCMPTETSFSQITAGNGEELGRVTLGANQLRSTPGDAGKGGSVTRVLADMRICP
jgi:hypothetical protein